MSTASIGQSIPRTESVAKVTGRARYAVEQHAETAPAYCWYVPAEIPTGRVTQVTAPADVTLLWHENAEKLGEIEDTELAVLQSDRVAYRGQIVAAVVADSLEAAREGAAQVRVTYAD
ncbi:MAG: xanthine dehydrogenase family protein molybdopterin-binding subunit, partial [Rhodococcus fascians]